MAPIQNLQVAIKTPSFHSKNPLTFQRHQSWTVTTAFLLFTLKRQVFLSPHAFLQPVNRIQSSPSTEGTLPGALPLNHHPSIHTAGGQVSHTLTQAEKDLTASGLYCQDDYVRVTRAIKKNLKKCEDIYLVQSDILRKQTHIFMEGGTRLLFTKAESVE